MQIYHGDSSGIGIISHREVMNKIFFLMVLFLSTGCSVRHYNSNKLASQLQQQSPEHILSILQSNKPKITDFAQHYLNMGYLQLLSGEFDAAIGSLTIAKKEMYSLSAISISENIAAGTINETFRKYSGYPTDRVMVHNMLALSYLFEQDVYGARVEMLQADVAMKKLAGSDAFTGQLSSTHLLSGIIYELLDERSNAFISYKLSEEVLQERKITVPNGLKLALLRMSQRMGNEKEYQTYRKKYPAFDLQVETKEKQVFNLYFDGIVSSKKRKSIMVPNNSADQLIRISMPAYPSIKYRSHSNKISDGIEEVNSQLIENIETLVREDLRQEYPSILLLTTSRAIVKYKLVKKAQKRSKFLGALVNVVTLLSEVADLRSWNMLPATIQFSYLETNENNISLYINNTLDSTVDINKGNQHVLLKSNLSKNIFHYQQ